MKRRFGILVIGAALLSGCGVNTPPPMDSHDDSQKIAGASSDKGSSAAPQPAPGSPVNSANPDGMNAVVARVNGEPVTMRQLVDPLIESRGLTMLVNLVELELAKQNAAKAKYHIVVTQKDFDDEHDRTLEKMFKDSDDAKLLDALDKAIKAKDAAEEAKIRAEIKLEREDYLTQFLNNQHLDRVEFEIVQKTNTYLRKILESEWKDKITDADVKAAFGQMYGEKVRLRYLDLMNMTEVGEAQRRLKDGDDFKQVAKDMSHDTRTAPLGGELPPISRDSVTVPKNFIDVAFSLRDGQISDIVVVGSAFMLIQRIEAIPPQHVFLDDPPGKPGVGVRPIVYHTLYEKLMEAGLKGMKKQLFTEAGIEMEIINPVLAKQMKDGKERQAHAQQRAQEELDLQARKDAIRNKLLHPSDTQPAPRTAPATGAAPAASTAPAGERPPATEPGSLVHPFSLPRLGPDTQPSVLPDANK